MKYVVQKAVTALDEVQGWEDIATIETEPRARRSTVLKQALAKANIAPGADKLKLRVLDAESAKVYEPEAHQPPAEWRLR